MPKESINRIRILLLAECFGISTLTCFINLTIFRTIFIFEPEALFSLTLIVLVTLSITGIVQILGNEKWLEPIVPWLDSQAGIDKAGPEKKKFVPLTRLFMFFAATMVLVTIALLILRRQAFLTVGQCFLIGGTGLLTGSLFFGAWLLSQKWRKPGQAPEKAGPGATVALANAFLKFPVYSAGLSLSLWFFAGVVMALGFYFWIGLQPFHCFYILVIAIGAGILAFPLQYLMFKRTLQGLVRDFVIKNPEIQQARNLFKISLRYKLLVYFLSLAVFSVSISFLTGYARTYDIVKAKAAKIFQLEFSRELEGLDRDSPDPESLTKIISEKQTKTVSYFLVSKNGEVMFGNPEKALSKSQLKKMLSQPEGVLTPARSQAIVLYKFLPDRNFYLGKVYSPQEFKGDLKSFRNIAVSVLLIMSVICVIFVFLASNEIFSPLKRLVEETRLVADRNFMDRPFPLTNDEMGELAHSFYKMRSNLRNYLQHLNGMMKKIEETAPMIDAATQLLSRVSSEQVSGSASQAASLEEVYATLEALTDIARELSSKSNKIEDSAHQTKTAYSMGNQVLVNAIHAVKSAQSQVNTIRDFTVSLEEHSRKIKDIVEIIEEISIQSNLLAFNALVESSAAGEAGQRFGIVANQMKRLAALTKELNTNTGRIIQDVLGAVSKIGKATSKGSELMSSSVELVSEAGMAFEGFASLIELSVNTAREVAGSMDFQVKTSEEMTRAIAGIKVVSAQLAGKTTEIEKSAQQLLKFGQELKNLTDIPGN